MLLEKKQREAQAAQLANNASTTQPATSSSGINTGDRVFHSKYGVGKVVDVKDIAGSTTYIVDFNSQGQKALDAAFAQLKKF